MIDPSSVIMSDKAVILNETHISEGLLKQRKLLNNPNLWHKIIVQNCKCRHRDFVLKTILDDVHPLDFIPVYYTREGTGASFFVRNCRMAIEKLCRQKLVVANPQNKDEPFNIMIILGYSNTSELRINVQENVSSVLSKRFNSATKTLNLDNFCKDPDLTEFCTLSQPKILYFVLHLSKHFQMQSLRLSNNDIRILGPIESIWGVKSLTTLDLRNNMIDKITVLNMLKNMQITELFLDGNPVCDIYDEFGYVEAVKEVCPKIEKLDGVLLGQNGFLAFRRNFICNAEGQELVDQFLEHYFTLYDSTNRSSLDGLYNKDSMFSLTCQYLPGQITTSTASLGHYKCKSRNLRLLSDLAKSSENLMQGASNIIRTLCSLPATEHDPYTFTVDLVYYKEQTAVLTVTGVFRETAQSVLDSERILGFTRTFVLVSSTNGEYQIANEQLNISNAATAQQQRAFKFVRVPRPSHLTVEPAKTIKERNEMEQALKLITNLNLEWSKKCLEECQYDLKKTLMLFVDLYKIDKIPEEAFVGTPETLSPKDTEDVATFKSSEDVLLKVPNATASSSPLSAKITQSQILSLEVQESPSAQEEPSNTPSANLSHGTPETTPVNTSKKKRVRRKPKSNVKIRLQIAPGEFMKIKRRDAIALDLLPYPGGVTPVASSLTSAVSSSPAAAVSPSPVAAVSTQTAEKPTTAISSSLPQNRELLEPNCVLLRKDHEPYKKPHNPLVTLSLRDGGTIQIQKTLAVSLGLLPP